MTDALVTLLLPGLARSAKAGFNVFDVMHHGTHEKQLSNVFGWLLDAEGSHELGDLFQEVFLDEVNRRWPEPEPFPSRGYTVLQEEDTSGAEAGRDIADLVLETENERIVVENYYTSDGHGHSFEGYLRHAQRHGRRGGVVLLCQHEDVSLQTDGWEHAAVVTYRTLLARLREALPAAYPRDHAAAHGFIEQMHAKFVERRGRMPDRDVLEFLTAMCATGEASRYAEQPHDAAARKFGEDVAREAQERMAEGRELLQRLKGRLQSYCEGPLRTRLDATLGAGFVTGVYVLFRGDYQWTLQFETTSGGERTREMDAQLKFGPSAYQANAVDSYWQRTVPREEADYARLFLTHIGAKEVRQSAVTLGEVLAGLPADDTRLHDELVALWRGNEA